LSNPEFQTIYNEPSMNIPKIITESKDIIEILAYNLKFRGNSKRKTTSVCIMLIGIHQIH
jgi:hypothetical protein